MTIVGNGNVAMDITRTFLLDPATKLAGSDAPAHVIRALKDCKLKTISVLGRRGTVQSAFTIKEIRQISKLDNVRLYLLREELERSINEESLKEASTGFSTQSKGLKRRQEFLE